MDETRYGLDMASWIAAKDEARTILIGYAKQKDTITYSELAQEIHSFHFEPHDFRLFGLIGEISTEESDAGRGMLSAVVVLKDEGMPGPGFFVLAKKLGFDTRDQVAFWTKELKRVYAAWNK